MKQRILYNSVPMVLMTLISVIHASIYIFSEFKEDYIPSTCLFIAGVMSTMTLIWFSVYTLCNDAEKVTIIQTFSCQCPLLTFILLVALYVITYVFLIDLKSGLLGFISMTIFSLWLCNIFKNMYLYYVLDVNHY